MGQLILGTVSHTFIRLCWRCSRAVVLNYSTVSISTITWSSFQNDFSMRYYFQAFFYARAICRNIGSAAVQGKSRRGRRTDFSEFPSVICDHVCKGRIHVLGECRLLFQKRGGVRASTPLETIWGTVQEGYGREAFESRDGKTKTIAIVGDGKWPEEARAHVVPPSRNL